MARILVVEDDLVQQRALSRLLATAHHEVASAKDLSSTLEALGHFDPDLLIADWLLVGSNGNGAQVASRLREAKPDVPILFVSGMPLSRIFPDLGRVAPFRFLGKPFTADALFAMVDQMLGGQEDSPA